MQIVQTENANLKQIIDGENTKQAQQAHDMQVLQTENANLKQIIDGEKSRTLEAKRVLMESLKQELRSKDPVIILIFLLILILVLIFI